MKDLTKGYPAKVILMFAMPIMFGNVFQQLYNLADGKVVSEYLEIGAFAAVGATGVVSNTIIGFINGLTQGFAIPVSNCYGARDYKKMRKYVAGTIVLTAIVSIILTVLSLLFIEDILILLNTPDNIMDDATSYVKIILAGIIFTSLYNMCANILRAVGDSKTPLYCLMAAVVINIGLDILFVRDFGWKIEGAAYATIISQALCGIACAIFILVRFKEILPGSDEWAREKGLYSNLVTTGLSMGLMSCVVNIGTIVLQGAINSLGTAIVAAHTAARKVFDILTVMIYSVAISMTTYIGQNMGAGKVERIRQGVRHALVMATIITTVMIVVCFAFGEPVFRWITSSDDKVIIDSAVMYSRVSIVFFYVLGPLLVLRCSLQGMGRKIIPVFSSVLEMVLKVLSANFLVPILAYKGVAITEPISWVVMTIILAVAYLTGNPEKYMKQKA